MNAAQCRAARALLNLSAQELATRAGVGVNTITRFEGGSGAQTRTVDKIKATLETAGILFLSVNGGGSGVRWKKEPLS